MGWWPGWAPGGPWVGQDSSVPAIQKVNPLSGSIRRVVIAFWLKDSARRVKTNRKQAGGVQLLELLKQTVE